MQSISIGSLRITDTNDNGQFDPEIDTIVETITKERVVLSPVAPRVTQILQNLGIGALLPGMRYSVLTGHLTAIQAAQKSATIGNVVEMEHHLDTAKKWAENSRSMFFYMKTNQIRAEGYCKAAEIDIRKAEKLAESGNVKEAYKILQSLKELPSGGKCQMPALQVAPGLQSLVNNQFNKMVECITFEDLTGAYSALESTLHLANFIEIKLEFDRAKIKQMENGPSILKYLDLASASLSTSLFIGGEAHLRRMKSQLQQALVNFGDNTDDKEKLLFLTIESTENALEKVGTMLTIHDKLSFARSVAKHADTSELAMECITEAQAKAQTIGLNISKIINDIRNNFK